ncbi:MAG: DUF2070 family protein [Thermoplasmata archaeon]|nr:MAG: DUF2070 family protein [Thermoplasmata archaeon]
MLNKRKKTVMDTQKSVEQTASIMEHLFRAPNPVKLIVPMLLVSLLAGMTISFDLDDLYQTFFINGIVLLALPAYISALASMPLATYLGGRLYLRRSILLSFLTLLIMAGVLLVFRLVNMLFSAKIPFTEVLIFAHCATIWLRHLSFISTSSSNHLRSLPASLIQPVLGLALIAVFFPPFGLNEAILAFMTLVIFLTSVILLAEVANAPLRRAFGINGLTMVRYSLDHITEGGDEGAREVEAFFNSFSEKVDAHVGLVSFKRGYDIKAIMIVPSVHPGPFGLLGGSDLPLKLAESQKEVCKAVLVPHGAATHDLNLSSSEEKGKIAQRVEELLAHVKYSNKASAFIRLSDSMDVCAQVFGDGILLVHTSSPKPTDDVDYSTGNSVREHLKSETGYEALFIDSHNCAERGSGSIYFGTKESYHLIDLAGKAGLQARKHAREGIKVGYAQKTGYDPEKGIGGAGIQVLLVESGDHKTAYVLFDGNNMMKGLREEILSGISGMVDESEVLTTDNHAVNATIGGFNPVGLRMENASLVSDVKNLVKQATEDLESVSVGMSAGLVKDINVFGHENIARLSSILNSTMATLKITVFSTLLFAVLASAVLYLLV